MRLVRFRRGCCNCIKHLSGKLICPWGLSYLYDPPPTRQTCQYIMVLSDYQMFKVPVIQVQFLMHQSVLTHMTHIGNLWDSDIFLIFHPRGLWQWYSNPGAVLPFKIKRFSPPWIGTRGDSETNDVNEGWDFDRKHFQMSESSVYAHEGTLVIHIDKCIKYKLCPVRNISYAYRNL